MSTPMAWPASSEPDQSGTAAREAEWNPPPTHPMPPRGSVHVWRASLDPPAHQVERLRNVLSDAEHVRSGEFFFARDRIRFIAARGLLRVILGRYLGIPPGHLRFRSEEMGKPAVCVSQASGIEFSVSHSHGLVVYAVSWNRRIGIDIERIRAVANGAGVPGRVFSARELAVFRALPRDQQRAAFFRAWTRKEACAKAEGQGLSRPLGQIDVSLAPFEPGRPLSIHGDPAASARWSLQDLVPAPGYAGALATEGEDGLPLRCMQWPLWL
jgi:4'-phosphopantetheinyl transferase